MEKKTVEFWSEYNQLYKETDEIYHLYAKGMGISDTVFWILYSIYNSSRHYTQREFCDEWHYPPQTLNSALKNLEKRGLIELKTAPGNQKNKIIMLTEEGKVFSERIIAPLVAAEQKTLEEMKGESEKLLSATRRYVNLLKDEVGKI